MGQTNTPASRTGWLILGLLAVIGTAGGGYLARHSAYNAVARHGTADETADTPDEEPPVPSILHVEVVHPRKGDMDRTTVQPGTVQPYEFAQLYAGVSGYLKTQEVDIGDRVKRGQILAVVDVPDLEKQVQKCQAALEQARARVVQMQARVTTAKADLEAAQAGIVLAEANAKSKAAERRFRQKQLDRMKELYSLKSIDERLVDEKIEQRDAAQETERAAVAAVANAKAQVTATAAKIQQAEADVAEAQAEVKVAQADLEKSQVMVRFATIVCPFDGIVTRRNFFPGDYVRAAAEGGARLPILTVERTDRMRVVVQIPDRDVPYTDPGDRAVVEIDALPGEQFPAKVSRISGSEDPATRLMHVEIDLPNPTGRIRQGMYGRVRIILEKSDLLSVPSRCVIDRSEGGKGYVYVVRDGRARRVPVRYSEDNGLKAGVLSGLTAEDQVILRPSSSLADGAEVVVTSQEQPAAPPGR